MTVDDLDRIRGKNERRREELEFRLAEQRKLRAAMSAELSRVQEALDKEYGAQLPPDTPGINEERPMRRIVLFVFLSLLCVPIAASEDSQGRLMTLTTDLPFRISIGGLSRIAKEAGLSEEWLENAVELGYAAQQDPASRRSPESRMSGGA